MVLDSPTIRVTVGMSSQLDLVCISYNSFRDEVMIYLRFDTFATGLDVVVAVVGTRGLGWQRDGIGRSEGLLLVESVT